MLSKNRFGQLPLSMTFAHSTSGAMTNTSLCVFSSRWWYSWVKTTGLPSTKHISGDPCSQMVYLLTYSWLCYFDSIIWFDPLVMGWIIQARAAFWWMEDFLLIVLIFVCAMVWIVDCVSVKMYHRCIDRSMDGYCHVANIYMGHLWSCRSIVIP